MTTSTKKGITMSENVIQTPDIPVEVQTKKTRRFHLPKLPSKTQVRNGTILVIGTAGSVLLLQNKLGKTVSLEVTTPDIVDSDTDQD